MFCKGQLGELQLNLPLLKRAGLGLAAISYDSRAALRDFAVRKGIAFPLLSDHDSVVIRAYGVADRRYRQSAEIEVDSSGQVPVYGLAYSAVFVLSPDGTVRWRFVSEHEELRLTAGNILQRSVGQIADRQRTPLEAGKVHLELTASDTSAGLGSRLMIGGVAYPEPRWEMPAFADRKLPEYAGTLRLTREFTIKPMISDANPAAWDRFRKSCLDSDSRLGASGSLEFQACTDRECFPPQSVPVKWSFAIAPPDRHRVPVEIWRVFEH